MNEARPLIPGQQRRAGIRAFGMAMLSLACLGIAGSAMAQDVEPIPVKPWALRLGAFFPTQGTLRNQSSTPYFAAGVDYHPDFRYHLLNGNVYFSADVDYREDSGTFLVVPLTANIVWSLSPVSSQYRIYAGLGGGIYFINTPLIGGTTQAGARFIVGVDVGPNWFGELNYQYVSGFTDNFGNGIKTDGLSFYIGRRF